MCKVLKSTIERLIEKSDEEIGRIEKEIDNTKDHLCYVTWQDNHVERADEFYEKLKSLYREKKKVELQKENMKFLSQIEEWS